MMGWSGNRLVNGALKVTACVYRPWIRDARIIPYGDSMTTATGYSFPSGHTMNAGTVFGGVAVRKGTPRMLRVLLWITVALVAFSRIFLGVHTPQDILVGFAASILVMWLTGKLMTWIANHPEKDWIVVVVGIGLSALLAVYAAVKPYPADYDANGKLIVDGAKMANDTFKAVGWTVGFLVGWILERRFVGFSTEVSLYKKLTRAVGGLLSFYAVSLILMPWIKEWLPGPAGTTISCLVQMLFISFIFPWCIKRLEKKEP
jgi:undecaprenyl-diphosphatase